MGERRLRDRPAGEYRLAAGPELQQETDGGIDRSEVRDSPWNPLAGNRSRDCLELASRKPSWPAAKSDRINRPDIWMQAIRSDHQELLQHGRRPHMESIGRQQVAGLFGTRVAETILASGQKRPHQQAGHMDASDPIRPSRTLAARGPSTYGFRARSFHARPGMTGSDAFASF